MKSDKDLTRRATLGLIGALGASVAAGCGGGDDSSSEAAGEAANPAAAIGKDTPAGTGTLFKPGGCSRELVLPHTASTVAETVTAHAVAELSNDLQTILGTMSAWDSHYAVLTLKADGTLNLRTAFTAEEVDQYYAANVAAFHNSGGEARLNELQGRWYDLIDTRYSVTLLPNGPTLTGVRGVFLFPTWTDGIIGEFYWGEPSWAQTFDIESPREFTSKLIAYEDAWRSGDVEARLATIEDQTCSCGRVASLSGTRGSRFVAKTKDELRAAWSTPEAGKVLELERLHHVTSTYYVFAAHRVVLEVGGEKVVRETATLLPIGPNRKFIGELSYSFEARR